MFDDFDTEIQSDELAAINLLYWEIENPADWAALSNENFECWDMSEND